MLVSDLAAPLAAFIDQLFLSHVFSFSCIVGYGPTML
jgi:hypothetical protein